MHALHSPPRWSELQTSTSKIAHSTIDQEFAANRECGFIGGEKDNRMSDLTGTSEAPGRNLILDRSRCRLEIGLGRTELFIKRCRDRTGTDGLHANAARDQFTSKLCGQRKAAQPLWRRRRSCSACGYAR